MAAKKLAYVRRHAGNEWAYGIGRQSERRRAEERNLCDWTITELSNCLFVGPGLENAIVA